MGKSLAGSTGAEDETIAVLFVALRDGPGSLGLRGREVGRSHPAALPGRAMVTECLGGARDEFHLAAIVQNFKTMALRLLGPPPALAPA